MFKNNNFKLYILQIYKLIDILEHPNYGWRSNQIQTKLCMGGSNIENTHGGVQDGFKCDCILTGLVLRSGDFYLFLHPLKFF